MPRHRDAVAWWIAGVVFAVGVAAAVYYGRAGLTLSHYDARAHVVVARRILDSLTPGWQQVGAVWLPLPHLLNMLPVQVDFFYRTGISGVLLSLLSMGAASWSLASLILRSTGSRSAAIAGPALLVLNPNALYLQSTPMTEPLLFGTVLLSIALTARWIEGGAEGWPAAAGSAMTCACLTRYEAWPISGAIVALAAVVLWRRGVPPASAARACARLAVFPILTAILFMANSRWTVGAWFVSTGFFVPENVEALGHPVAALRQLHEGLYRLSGSVLVWAGYAGGAAAIGALVVSRRKAPLALLLALVGAAAVPWYAYVQGHPFRIRYDVPLVAAAAALAAAGVALLPRFVRPVAAVMLVAAAAFQAPPLDRSAPMVIEAQRDARNLAGRRAVTEYLRQHYDGGTIMMSMGSLAHYMQDLSHEGFAIKDFLHEGNGELWGFGLVRARRLVEWVAVEEKAEGGDALAWETKRNRHFLQGFTRVAQGGGVSLYRANGKGERGNGK